MSLTPEYREDETAHRPFRAWALQHDLSSLLGGTADWRVSDDQLGLEPDEDPAAGLSGQGFLREGLTVDPRIPLRIKTSITLWLAALITDVLNQLLPVGLHMPTDAFWITVALVLVPLTIATSLYPRMSPERFVIVEQCILTYASLVIIYQCSKTGGSDSPYLIWFLLTTYYAAYLLPSAQGRLNIATFIGLIPATLLLSGSPANSMIYLQLIVLIVVVWLLGVALLRQRTSEEALERAVSFMALADPHDIYGKYAIAGAIPERTDSARRPAPCDRRCGPQRPEGGQRGVRVRHRRRNGRAHGTADVAGFGRGRSGGAIRRW